MIGQSSTSLATAQVDTHRPRRFLCQGKKEATKSNRVVSAPPWGGGGTTVRWLTTDRELQAEKRNWKACDLGAGCDENDIVMVAVRNLRPTNRLAMRLIYNDRVPENESQVDSIPTIMKITALLNFVLWRFNFPPRTRPKSTDLQRPRDSCCFRWKFADIW